MSEAFFLSPQPDRECFTKIRRSHAIPCLFFANATKPSNESSEVRSTQSSSSNECRERERDNSQIDAQQDGRE